MPGKRRIIYSIDTPAAGAFNAGGDPGGTGGTASVIPPAQPIAGPPTNLALSTAIERNAVTPTSLIDATWYPPAGVSPTSYVVQWSTSSVFATVNGAAAASESARISGLIPNTLYYVRVAAMVANVQGEYSATASITTAADTVAPNPISGLSIAFAGGGDLVITWTNPTSANFQTAKIIIYDGAARSITYATLFNATGRLTWTVAQNLAATAGAGDPSLFIDIWAQSWGGILSTVASAGPLTKSAPAAPTVTLVKGYNLAVATVTSTPESPYSLFEYVWKRDGVTQRTDLIADTTDEYTAGTTVGDEGSHSWTVVVRQRDAFGQFSSTTTPAAVVIDALTIDYLRSGAFYSDDIASTFVPPAGGALAAMKDGITASGGISYAA